MATGMAAVRASAKGITSGLPNVPGLIAMVIGNDATVSNSKTGTVPHVMSLTKSGSNIVLSDTSAAFDTDDIGQVMHITGASNAVNNGYFPCTARSATTATFTNAAGVSQAGFAGTWTLMGRVSSVVDRVAGRTFSQGTAVSRPPLMPPSLITSSPTGKKAWGRMTAATWLECANAAWSAFDSDAFLNVALLMRLNDAPGGVGNGSTVDLMSIASSSAFVNAALRFRVTGTAGSLSNVYLRTQASASTTWSTLWGYDGSRTVVAVGYTGQVINEMEQFFNGVKPGSQDQPTARVPTGIATMFIGAPTGAPTPAVVAAMAVGVGALWTEPQQTLVMDYFNTEYPP